MTQTAVPTTDTTRTAWTTDSGGTTNLFQQIDETVAAANDADYDKSATPPGTNVYVTKLSSVTDPVSSVSHTIEVRCRKQPTGGATRTLTVELRQGYVNEGSQGTLIATLTDSAVADSFTTRTYTLTGAEADAITNYGDLYLRFVAS